MFALSFSLYNCFISYLTYVALNPKSSQSPNPFLPCHYWPEKLDFSRLCKLNTNTYITRTIVNLRQCIIQCYMSFLLFCKDQTYWINRKVHQYTKLGVNWNLQQQCPFKEPDREIEMSKWWLGRMVFKESIKSLQEEQMMEFCWGWIFCL